MRTGTSTTPSKTSNLYVLRPSIDFLPEYPIDWTQTPMETTRRSTIEREHPLLIVRPTISALSVD
jgi:hypothetical protein